MKTKFGKIRMLELFGGYGSQALALENLGIEFSSDLCEIDRYAIQAYNQLHGETFNYGDICTIDETKLPHYELITYSSPCQDFSIAGKQAGGEKGSGTRSSLLWECERIIRAVKPEYLLMENVKALTSKKFMPLFQQWLSTLESMGYQNYWKVLNAKDYGVPQNRERVFVVSILGGGEYKFPDPIPLTKRLKDVLEPNVDEKYYVSDSLVKRLDYQIKHGFSKLDGDVSCTQLARQYANSNGQFVQIAENTTKGYADAYDGDSVNLEQPNSKTRRGRVGHQMANTLTTSCNQGVMQIGNIVETESFGGNPQRGRIYSADGCSPSLNTCQGGGLEPKITEYRFFDQAIQTAEEKGAKDGDTIDAFNKRVNESGVSPTLTTRPEGFKTAILPVQGYRIRKLTPRECWRLMGVRDEQFDRLSGISNSQLYKLAGNAIVVDVLMGIFKNMFVEEEPEFTIRTITAEELEKEKKDCYSVKISVRSEQPSGKFRILKKKNGERVLQQMWWVSIGLGSEKPEWRNIEEVCEDDETD